MSQSQTVRTVRGIQQSLLFPAAAPLPAEPLETKGVVYTKRWVVELVLDLAGYRPENNLVDATAVEPAAGEGAFLGPMVERLLESCRQFGRHLSECRDSLIAFELDEESAGRARTLATGILLRNGVNPAVAENLGKAWIRTGDYLFEAVSMEADFVVGNPPYVRLEEIPEETATRYRDAYPTMRGRADLYVAFFEAGLRQLKEGGVCAFICADRWMRNQYGGVLRELVTSAFSVDVVVEMHNADAFHDEVDAYPAITVIRRHTQGTTVVACAGPEAGGIGAQTLSATLLATGRREPLALPSGLRTSIVDTWFRGRTHGPVIRPDNWRCFAILRNIFRCWNPMPRLALVSQPVMTASSLPRMQVWLNALGSSSWLWLAISVKER